MACNILADQVLQEACTRSVHEISNDPSWLISQVDIATAWYFQLIHFTHTTTAIPALKENMRCSVCTVVDPYVLQTVSHFCIGGIEMCIFHRCSERYDKQCSHCALLSSIYGRINSVWLQIDARGENQNQVFCWNIYLAKLKNAIKGYSFCLFSSNFLGF